MDEKFDQYVSDINKLLYGYGQDLAMSGAKPWEQRFGAPDIALVLIPIAGWFIKTVLEVIVEHEVKKRLEREPIEKKISDIDSRLHNIEVLVNQTIKREISIPLANEKLRRYYSEVMQQYESLGRPDYLQIKTHNEELLEVLQGIGLTRRRALKLSAEIIEVSEKILLK
jgi:hypothetical protein